MRDFTAAIVDGDPGKRPEAVAETMCERVVSADVISCCYALPAMPA